LRIVDRKGTLTSRMSMILTSYESRSEWRKR